MSNPALSWHAKLAAKALKAGQIIAYPTEGVWGLGCDPSNRSAMTRLAELKQRPLEKGVILIAADLSQVEYLLAPLAADMRATAENLWPGFVTCLLPDLAGQVPEWIRGRHTSVAVRVSRHPPVEALCRAFGGPIVSTSCNPSGRPPARSNLEARRYFNATVTRYMMGETGKSRGPSPILDLRTGKYLRS